jgi:hypothetical protein
LFDLEECRERVQEAISSRQSVSGGEKLFNYKISPKSGCGTDIRPVKKGEKMLCEKISLGVTMNEKVAERRDPKVSTCCVACGSPKNLSTCSQCKTIWYCGRGCQVNDWRNHRDECAEMKKERKLQKQKK